MELFDNLPGNKITRVRLSAFQLTIKFYDPNDLPSHFKPKTEDKKKKKSRDTSDSMVRARFDKTVDFWETTIQNIIDNIKDSEQAWRFIELKPHVDKTTTRVTACDDFNKFTDYFVLRRDINHCCDNELGCLATLHTAFMLEIEKIIQPSDQPKEQSMEKPDFVAVDFEHATRNKGSVCSVGIVSFKDNAIVDEYYTLIQPPNNEYESINIHIHHINPIQTNTAPQFYEVYSEIKKRLYGNKVIAHGAFHTDKHCLEQAMEANDIHEDLKITWDCTQNICNSKLNIACEVCNIPLIHHDALSDAKACGLLYQKYLMNDIPFDEIQEKKYNSLSQPKTELYPTSLKGDVLKPDFEHAKNKDNPFFMKKVVVTGFCSNKKIQLAEELKAFGADVDTSVTGRTHWLITGDAPGLKKIEKMQDNINNGKEAQIITYSEYSKIMEQYY